MARTLSDYSYRTHRGSSALLKDVGASKLVVIITVHGAAATSEERQLRFSLLV